MAPKMAYPCKGQITILCFIMHFIYLHYTIQLLFPYQKPNILSIYSHCVRGNSLIITPIILLRTIGAILSLSHDLLH